MTSIDFTSLLAAFAAAVVADDGPGLAGLFTADGTYDDGFFGPYTGRPAIEAMVRRFHETGEDYRWDWLAPLGDGTIGYAGFRFSYRSRLAGCAGKPVMFEGIGHFRFAGGLITRYSEAFDRGLALVQLDFPAARIRRVVEKAAAAQNAAADARPHLDRFGAG